MARKRRSGAKRMYRGYSSVALQELFEIDTNSKGTRGHS